jgi:hypothetical protein
VTGQCAWLEFNATTKTFPDFHNQANKDGIVVQEKPQLHHIKLVANGFRVQS